MTPRLRCHAGRRVLSAIPHLSLLRIPAERVVAKFPSDAPLSGAVALASNAISADGDRTNGQSVDLSSVMLK
jgi:hypothetical protein